ncbi:DEAD/DEAH box helicase [Lachnoanaerobaculum sp.]
MIRRRGKINNTNSILDAWIMVEHLSEGDISLKDTKNLRLDDLTDKKYFDYFNSLVEKANIRRCKNSGFVIYFDIFDFAEVVEFLRQTYGIAKPEGDIKYGHKFSLALYFDKTMKYIGDNLFFSASAYMRYYRKVPTESDFHKFEEDLKDELKQRFENCEDNPEKFDNAVETVLNKYGIELKNCRVQLLNNIETDATNLHSFFVDDLTKAKRIDNKNLNDYLYGKTTGRKNLDSKKDSSWFNKAEFEKILSPENYPLGRFPSNTKFALSFMQQVAVNLTIGFDNNQIRSVNGPPGTGKTTLLKDIFAELIVEQALDISGLSEKYVKGSELTRYSDKAFIGELHESIARNNIVVASSNNGAVQNIVNELPLKEGIDENILPELEAIDYFKEIANKSIKVNRVKQDGKDKYVKELELVDTGEEKFWGSFSLEGGKSDNMTNILNRIECIINCLENEYEPDDEIYNKFKVQYKKVLGLRNDAKSLQNKFDAYYNAKSELNKIENTLLNEDEERRKKIAALREQAKESVKEKIVSLNEASSSLNSNKRKREELSGSIANQKMLFESKQSQKPGFFSSIFNPGKNKNFTNELNVLQNKLQALFDEDESYRKLENELQNKINELKKSIDTQRNAADNENTQYEAWRQNLNSRKEKYTQIISEFGVDNIIISKGIDFGSDYEKLQLSNPWFDENYRVEQSKLFVSALGVRKQFLYENIKNIKAAVSIWRNQSKYMGNKRLINISWNWINLTIPVISSTFASFSRMLKNIDENVLGHTFVDEAGQALPQAAVGAIFRSKNIMVVGDPFQIKPVLTLDGGILALLSKSYNVSEKYLSESASVQTLVDAASQYGFYTKGEEEEDSWIGIPLWVHRRCKYPMFTISNAISYNNLMVQGNEGYGKTGWYDISGKAVDKYVEEQGDFLLKKIQSMSKENPKILDKTESDTIYIISPFKNVAYRLAKKLDEIGFTRRENGKPTNIGTIHTFQGKEAPIVFMVLGADTNSKGAATWAVNEANMMNVAATRAKKEFYIIGDRKLYKSLGSEVITKVNNVITEYGNEHPELVDEITD